MLKLLPDNVSHHVSVLNNKRRNLISLCNPSLYLPTVLVVGLHGWILPPLLILICDLFVYAEFLIHPVILLTTSGKLRREITASISSKYTVRDLAF